MKQEKKEKQFEHNQLTFSIKKLSTKKSVAYNFQQNQQLNTEKNTSLSMMPKYNKDNLYYTPAFVHASQTMSRVQFECYRILHEQKIRDQKQINKKNILKPKPSERNSYCTICKVRFENYSDHIEEKNHVQKMLRSEFQKDIMLLCNKAEKQRSQNVRPPLLRRDKTGEPPVRKRRKKQWESQRIQTEEQSASQELSRQKVGYDRTWQSQISF